MNDFHLIRPFALLAFLPLIVFLFFLFNQKQRFGAWQSVCDAHLLPHLLHTSGKSNQTGARLLLFFSAFWMVLALSGPSWTRLPVPTYKKTQPRILLLEMSSAMGETDLSPNRLSRAKFKLHDLFNKKEAGQFGLLVYSEEPFIVSPLTDDGQTIDSLLSSLTPDVMPIEGNRLDLALNEAAQLFVEAGFSKGDILVLGATEPTQQAIDAAHVLADNGIRTSIMPITADTKPSSLFLKFAKAGKGERVLFQDTSTDLDQWLKNTSDQMSFSSAFHDEIPVFKDEGRWFIIPALLCLLPFFRRGFLERVNA